ncbi:MAG: peptidase BlaR1, partial [Paenibacillus sp.]|nr:peptidase BlaR1 [Paenibacillus sp.]
MNETIKLLLSLSLSGSLLAVLIFTIKPFIRPRLSKSIQYYIWVIVLLRLLLPFSFEESIMNHLFYSNETSEGISSQGTVQPMDDTGGSMMNLFMLPNVQEKVASGAYKDDADHSTFLTDLFNQYVFYLWLLGVIIALGIYLTGYVRFSKQLKQTNEPAAYEENRILADLSNGRSNVRLFRNRFVTTPILIGIFRPSIIIPAYHFNEIQLKNILLHEITHLRRFDLAFKWLTMIVTSLHWFNPLMYLIKKEINRACELACDEAVIKNLNAAEKQAYGDTLISVAAEQKYSAGILQATMFEEKKSLKERLLAIMTHNPKSKFMILLSFLLLLVVVGGALALGAGIGKTNAEINNLQTDQYQLSAPKEWSIQKLPGSSLSYTKEGKVIGGLDIIEYYPDQPISQLRPNHTEVLDSKQLEGFFTETIQEKLKRTPPAASGDTTAMEQIHIYFIMKDKRIAYDHYFNTQDVDEQT